MRQITLVLLMICMVPAAAISQEIARRRTVEPNGQGRADQAAPPAEDFVIGPEDTLSIFVWHELELTNKVTVRPDGKIGMPLLNDVRAAGLTPMQLQQNITEGLRKFIAAPQVSVIVDVIRSQNVYVNGAVARPGVFPLGGPMTIMELLVRAGGFMEFAKTDSIQIFRKEEGRTQRFGFNYKTFVEGRDFQQNFLLKSGDLVIIP